MDTELVDTAGNQPARDTDSALKKIAIGVMWFLIWLGFGGCVYLSHLEGPLVVIKTDGSP